MNKSIKETYEAVTFIVEGNIGAGKSTFIRKLTEELNRRGIIYKVYKEEINNEVLNKYYDNPQENGYEFQEKIIAQRLEQLKKVNNEVQINIFDRSLLSTRIFTKVQKHSGYINKEQANKLLRRTDEYANIYNNAQVLYWNPGLKIEKERQKERNRDTERKMRDTYQETVARTYRKEMRNVYRRHREENDTAIADQESKEYSQYINKTANRLILIFNQQIQHFVLNVLYRRNKVYLLRRLDQPMEYYMYYQVPGGRLEYKETIEKACIRETLEETGIELTIERIEHVKTDKEETRTCELFMIQLYENEEPNQCEPMKNTKWVPYTIRKLFKNPTIILTPTLQKYSNQIITQVNERKHNYLDTPVELLNKVKRLTVKKLFRNGRRNQIRKHNTKKRK